MAVQVIHRIVIAAVHGVRCEIAVVGIPDRQALTFQVMGHALSNGVGELRELVMARWLYPTKLRRSSILAAPLDPIQEQHVKMDIQIQGAYHRASLQGRETQSM